MEEKETKKPTKRKSSAGKHIAETKKTKAATTKTTKKTSSSTRAKTQEASKTEKKTVSRNSNTKKTTRRKAKDNDERIKKIISEQLGSIDQYELKKGNKSKIESANEKEDKIPSKKTEKARKIKRYEEDIVEYNPYTDEEEYVTPKAKVKNDVDLKAEEEKMEEKKKLPKDEKNKIYKKMLINFLIGVLVSLYLLFLSLGFVNINPEKFLVDIKVFSVILVALAIVIFEFAYKKDSGEIAIKGIEFLALGIMTLSLNYIFILKSSIYKRVDMWLMLGFIIYYFIKNTFVYLIEKKKYKNTISDVKQIIAED